MINAETQISLMLTGSCRPMCIYDLQTQRFLAVNSALARFYDYSESELLSMRLSDLWVDDLNSEETVAVLSTDILPQQAPVTCNHRRKGGSRVVVEVTSDDFQFQGRSARQLVMVDITLRVNVESEWARLHRAYQMLSNCNMSLIRATSQAVLLEQICRIAVEIGGYLGAWVGIARDRTNNSISRLAFAGVMPSYSPQIRTFWERTAAEELGAAGRTIQTGKTIVVNDIETSADTAQWRDGLRAANIRGFLCLPLHRSEIEETFGVILLYSREVFYPSSEEIQLLEELANDLAFGIGNLRAKEEAARDVQARMDILETQQEIALLNTDVTSVMTVMSERARKLCDADGGAIDIAEGEELICHACSGLFIDSLGSRISMHDSLAGFAIRSSTTMLCVDSETDQRVDINATRRAGARSLVIAPLKGDGKIIGVIKVSSARPHAFGEREATHLQILAETLGSIIMRHRVSEQLKASESQYRLLFAKNPQPMWVYDCRNLRLLAVNQAMMSLYGYAEQELLDMTVRELWLHEENDREESLINRPADQWAQQVVRRHRKKDGTPIDVELSASPAAFSGSVGRMVLAVDVTQRIRAEQDLARVSRAQEMLSACNDAQIRATSLEALLKDICMITTGIGGYLGAWIGIARDNPERSIDRVAFSGVMAADGPGKAPSWTESSERGRGPAGRTIRSGKTVIVTDIEQEEDAQLPRKNALRFIGARGLISLPLKDAKRTFGLLLLLSSEVIAVNEDEVRLLEELANHLAFGLGNLQMQAVVRHQASLLDKAQDAIILRDMDGHIEYWNKGAERLYGWTADEVLGKSMLELKNLDIDTFENAKNEVLAQGTWTGEMKQNRKDGSTLWIEARWALVQDEQRAQSILSINTDISERKLAAQEIHQLAYYDSLTGLANRQLLVNELQQTLLAVASSGRSGALLSIDLDNFKVLNDTLGHSKGDLLLQQVAARLCCFVSKGDTVARIGGDEFVVLLNDLGENDQEAARVARAFGEKILTALSTAYQLDGYEHRSTSSIGVVPFGGQHAGVSELLKQADLAMYGAKAAGRNAIRLFDPVMQEIVVARAKMEIEMRQALVRKEYILYYQSQLDDSENVIGLEALIRWNHPQSGFVSPAHFIPLAEETGIIIPLGHWVLVSACEQLVAWESNPNMAHLTIAVNVSALQFRSADFVQQVAQVLRMTGANPGRLKLELTESALVDDLEAIIGKMMELRILGVHFSLDDFGTGYSSLSYLKRLPLDQLKIDQSFVRDILTDSNNASIVCTIIALGKSLGLNVIAEGVETSAQRDFLSLHGCKAYQGYLFSRPLPVQQLNIYLQDFPAKST